MPEPAQPNLQSLCDQLAAGEFAQLNQSLRALPMDDAARWIDRLDDAQQGVTLVTRGEDLFHATHVHRLLQALLGFATPRYYHTATRLMDGSILVVGGYNNVTSLTSAERWNPATGLWTPAGTMFVPRAAHTATLLPDGKVLVVGGINFATRPSGWARSPRQPWRR